MKKIIKCMGWWDRLLLSCVLLIIVIIHGVLGLRIARVCGYSMASTYDDGECVITISAHCSRLKRGDVITFYPDQDSRSAYIKRIIGLPGETIEAKENTVLVEGKPIDSWDRHLGTNYYSTRCSFRAWG